jgi:hypothetical protein
MTPELTILIINAVFMAYAYLWAYPAIPNKTISAVMIRDAAISGAALLVAGLLYWGSGTGFDLLVIEVNWAVFSVVTLFLIELPLSAWFIRKYDLDL